MKSFRREVQLHTAGGLCVTDITEEVADAVRESGVRAGICSVYSPHTTCSVRVNEWERGFLEDFAVMLRRLVPTEPSYAHDERRTENIAPEDQGIAIGNGRARRMSMLLGPTGESMITAPPPTDAAWRRSGTGASARHGARRIADRPAGREPRSRVERRGRSA